MGVIHYTGRLATPGPGSVWSGRVEELARAVDRALEACSADTGYGSLACGADLLVASRLLARGGTLHVFVPQSIEWFLERSVRPGGAAACAEFERLRAEAASFTIVRCREAEDDGAIFARVSRHAMGAALAEARTRGSHAVQIAVLPGGERGKVSGSDIRLWEALGGRTVVVGADDAGGGEPGAGRGHTDWRVGPLDVEEELEVACRAASLGMQEFAAFGAARILEVLAKRATQALRGGAPPAETHRCLEYLRAARHAGESVLCCAHALRRLGNDVRHVSRPIGPEEGWLGLALLAPVLRWHSAAVGGGDGSGLADGLPPAVADLERAVMETLAAEKGEALARVADALGTRLDGLVPLALIMAERAVDFELWPLAERLLHRLRGVGRARRRAEDLEALMWSRRGRPDKAVALLETACASGRRYVDAERSGILAGAWKRIWLRDGDGRALKRAARLYLETWEHTADVYAGVNAAACALWLGQVRTSRRIAQQTLTSMSLPDRPNRGVMEAGFYYVATAAELMLLCGDSRSSLWEEKALSLGRGVPIEVFRRQMALHRQRLGESMPVGPKQGCRRRRRG